MGTDEGATPVASAAATPNGEGSIVSEQPVEAPPAYDAPINLKEVLISIARSELHDYPGPKTNWSPSAFAKCDRAMILEHSGRKKNPITDQTALFFWMGHIIHDAVQKAVATRLPGVVWHEVPVWDQVFHVSGKLDTLRMVRMPDGSLEVFFEVYEYKGVRTRAFDFDLPQDAHVLQVAIYLTFPAPCPTIEFDRFHKVTKPHSAGTGCDVCGGAGVLPLPRRARIAYIGKEDGRIETYTVDNTTVLQEAVKAKLLSLQEQYDVFIRTGVMPEKLPKKQVRIKGVPQVYKRANKKTGVKVGDPKVEDDHRTYNCDYKGQGVCCADKDAI